MARKVTESRRLECDLQNHISGLLTEAELRKFKSIIQQLKILDRGTLERCTSFADIWHELEQADDLQEGNYETLTYLFGKMKWNKLVGEIKEYEKRIQDAIRRSTKRPNAASTKADAITDTSSMRNRISQPQSDLDLPVYDMDANPRGLCVIFSNIIFEGNESGVKESNPVQVADAEGEGHRRHKFRNRKGGEYDQNELEALFTDLNFTVQIREELTSKEIMDEVKSISKYQVKRDHDCLVMFILSHGDKGIICGVDGKPVEIDDIVYHFKPLVCKPLADKPKMFFIQACQGGEPCPLVVADKEGPAEPSEIKPKTTLPNESDILIGYAATPGYTSWRDEDSGTYYISTLVEMIKKHGNRHDLLEILTCVNEDVSRKIAKIKDKYGKWHVYKQSPLIHSTLRKKVFLL